ncbi:hypothetical protein LY76DRAFT_644505 [Colletotrichum caudatum]|nr:hypothetical protein LY76DRAFT_644505 [Colletotrichum caudatum]
MPANAEPVIAGPESAAWFTAVTIVDGRDKLKSAKARGPRRRPRPSADSNGVCKRAVKGSGSDGSGTRPKGNSGAGGWSAASDGSGGLPLAMAAAAVFLRSPPSLSYIISV